MKVSDGGELLGWPASSASGWLIKVGDQQIISEADGSFKLVAPSNLSARGVLCHPTDESLSTPDFALDSLGTSPQDVPTLVIPMFFHGPCAMSEGDDPMCGVSVPGLIPRTESKIQTDRLVTAAKLVNASAIQARFYNPPTFDPTKPTIPGITLGPIAGVSYPRPESYLVDPNNVRCPSTDGIFGDGGKVVDEKKYILSTCDLAVLDGSCPNENCLSDEEYRNLFTLFPSEISFGAAAGKLYQNLGGGHFSAAVTPIEALTGSGPPGVGGACMRNHHGRSCGEFQIGDLALAKGGSVALVGKQLTLRVPAGRSSTLTVHNNGVFGFTDIRTVKSLVGVQLKSPRLASKAGVQRLEHFEKDPNRNTTKKQFLYHTDETLTVSVEAGTPSGEEASYSFTVDNQSVELLVQVGSPPELTPALANIDRSNTTPTPFALSGPVVAELVAYLGSHPGSSAVYRWSLSGEAGGTLAAGNLQGRSFDSTTNQVVYVKNSNAQGGQQDQLQLEVLVNQAGEMVSFGSVSAPITINDATTILLIPGNRTINAGETVSISSIVSGLPSGTPYTYHWSLTGGADGTLNDGQHPAGTNFDSNSAQVVYTPGANAPSGSEDTVMVQVTKVGTGGAPDQILGTALSTITVRGSANWTSRPVGQSQDGFNSVAFGNSLYVAGGEHGNAPFIASSSDGVTWTEQTLPSVADHTSIQSLHYFNGTFIAVAPVFAPASAHFYTSSDGSNWTEHSVSGYRFHALAYADGRYVGLATVGLNVSVLLNSTDLRNWTEVDQSIFHEAVAYGNGKFVAVGSDLSGGKIITSPDGLNWTVQVTPPDTYALLGVTYGQSLYVAVGGDTILTSSDGITWTSRSFNPDLGTSIVRLRGVVSSGTQFKAVGDKIGSSVTQIFSSDDGLTWTADRAGDGDFLYDVVFGSRGFVAVGFHNFQEFAAILTNP